MKECVDVEKARFSL